MSLNTAKAKLLTCTDRHGHVADFSYTVKTDASGHSALEWTYQVWSLAANEQNDFFQLTLAELDSDTVRVVMLANNRYAPVSGKGIFDALIPRVAEELGRRVQSSPTSGATADVRRSGDATKAWQRLVEDGKAQFDATNDIFFVDKPTT